jgi:hypothetical protein
MKINKKISQISCMFFLAIFANKSSSSTTTWDFDADGEVDALTDGLLFLRHAFGHTGNSLTEGALSPNSTMTSSEVEQNIKNTLAIADIDNDGKVDALTDGLILIRYLFDVRGQGLVDQVISASANRKNSTDIENYILQHMPNSISESIQPELSESELIQTAKNMIESIREFGLQSTYEDAEELSVAEQIELASSFSNSAELEALSSAINTASKMFAKANSANLDALENNPIGLSNYNYIGHNGNATPVNIIEINNGYRYEINSPITGPAPNNVAVDLNLYAEITIETEEVEIHSIETRGNEEQLSVPVDNLLSNEGQINRHTYYAPTLYSETTRSHLDGSLMLSGTIKTPYHEATISSGTIELYTYENLSAWFNGYNAPHQNSVWDNSQPNNTPLMYTETENNDYAVGYGLNLNVDLNLEISQTNIDNPVNFTGTLSFLPKHSNYGGIYSHLTLSNFNRTVSKVYFTEDLPILELGLDSDLDATSGELINPITPPESDDRPLYTSDMVTMYDLYGLDELTLSGEFRQNNQSVKAILTGSVITRRDSWGGVTVPVDLSDLLAITENFDQIPGGYAESNNAFGTTIEDLIDLTNEFNDLTNYSYDVRQQDINNLGIALEFETSAASDITGISISTSNINSNQPLSLDVALGSSRLEFDITNHRREDLLHELGTNIYEFSDNLYYDYGVDIYDYYDFSGFDLNYDLMRKLSVTDHNNTQLHIFESCPFLLISCNDIGSITVNNKTAATISYDQENDVYIILYNDDSFEVL